MAIIVPSNTENLIDRIIELLNTGKFVDAERFCHMLIARDTPFAKCWFYLGAACHHQKKYDQALLAFQKAIDKEPKDIDSWHGLAALFSDMRRYEDALNAAENALALDIQSSRSLTNVGTAWHQLGDLNKSTHFFKEAIAKNQRDIKAYVNLVVDLIRQERMIEARDYSLQALKVGADKVALYNNLAEACIHLFRYDEALQACDSGLELDITNSALHLKKGLVLAYLKRFGEAKTAFAWAQILNPNAIKEYFPQWFGITTRLNQEMEIALDPILIYINSIYHKQRRCNWKTRGEYLAMIQEHIFNAPLHMQSEAVSSIAFQMYSFSISAKMRLEIMRKISNVAKSKAWCSGYLPLDHSKTIEKKRIRIGYLSPDFRHHATSVLIRQLYELHDKSQFQIYAYSLFNAATMDNYRAEIEKNCDVFRDVSLLNIVEIANQIHSDEVDILIDLAGYTTHSRTEIMAIRPAPIQMSYIGFVCTMGADFIDYAIVDTIVCADEYVQDWDEKLIRMPHSLYVYDNEVDNLPTKKQRKDYGLPENSVVFCCLNDNYKIDPTIFDVWMEILHALPDSVLWLLSANEIAEENLKREAQTRDVDPSRLVFASRVPMKEHLARYQLADIFLDTYWCNAHTTALEALWQGLPVLTCIGPVASSRIAASFLYALEMPELVTQTFEQYQQLAVFYGSDKQARERMREKLKAKRYTAPLFDTAATVRYIEKGYQLAWQRYQSGLPPQLIDVPADMVTAQTAEANKGLH